MFVYPLPIYSTIIGPFLKKVTSINLLRLRVASILFFNFLKGFIE